MARPELKGRQFTIYANREEDLRKWKELCPPMTLNGWILEMIERGIENRIPRTNDTQELNDLRKKVQELTKENEMMGARLHQREILDTLERSKGPMQLDKQIIDLLKTGGSWPSTRIIANINHREMEDRAYPTTALEERVMKNANSKRRKAIKHTLDALESVGLIELTPQGWRLWK